MIQAATGSTRFVMAVSALVYPLSSNQPGKAVMAITDWPIVQGGSAPLRYGYGSISPERPALLNHMERVRPCELERRIVERLVASDWSIRR